MLIWKDMIFFIDRYSFQEFDSLEFSLHYQKQNLRHAHLNRAKYVSYPSTAASSLCKIYIWKKTQKLKLIMATMCLTHRLYEKKSCCKKYLVILHGNQVVFCPVVSATHQHHQMH